MPSLLHSIVPPATASGTPSLCASAAAARSARKIPVTDEKLSMPAPRALALRSGTVVVAPSLKTPRRLCFLSPRPRKVVVTEVQAKPSTGRRLIHRDDGASSTPRRLCFISPLVPPKTKKQRPEGEDDDDEEDDEDKDTASQLLGVDIEEEQEEDQEAGHEELEAAMHEEEEDIFLSAQEDEDDEEEEDILLSPQEEEEEETVPVEVDDENDIVFTKITQSLNHADVDAGYDEEDSVPIAVLFHNDNNKHNNKQTKISQWKRPWKSSASRRRA